MALTLSELRTRVQTNTNRTDKDTQIDVAINDAIKDIGRHREWKDLRIEKEITLTIDTYRYAFPSDMNTCLSMKIYDGTESVELMERTKEWLNRAVPAPASDGTARPQYYAVDGNYYELYPVPNEAYTVRILYLRWPAELTLDSQACDIDGIDDVVVSLATSGVYASLGQLDMANYWENKYLRSRKDASIADSRRPNYHGESDGITLGGSRRGLPANYWNRPDIG